MRMTEIDYSGPPPIDSYAPGGFRVAGVWHAGDLVVSPDGVEPMGATGLSPAALAPLIAQADRLDVVLIGQGAEIAPLDAAIRAELDAAGLGVEQMSTPSACRTYNVLLTENRRVAALLIAL